MAVTTSPRLLLTRWSAGSDPFTRAQLDQDFADLDNLAAIDLQGTLAARPAAGTRGRYYFATDDGPIGRLYRDTGTAWVLLTPTATLGAAPTASGVGDAAAEGASTAAARADHRHAREAFGTVVGTTAYGLGPANGAAPTVARSDHAHGTPGLTAATPPALAADDPGAAGVGLLPAREDHRHPLTTSTPGAIAVGDTAAEGSSADLARADHRHAMLTATELANALIPAGVITPYGGAAAPAGWLLCNGAAVARAAYPALFAALGGTSTPWGLPGGAGGTDFNVPDLRGRAPIGAGAGAGLTNRVLAGLLGAETVALTLAQSPSHSHTVNAHSHTVSGTSDGNNRGHSHGLEGHHHAINHWHLANIGERGWAQGSHDHYAGWGSVAEGPRPTGGSTGSGGQVPVNVDGTAQAAPGGNNISGGAGWTGGQHGESQNHTHTWSGTTSSPAGATNAQGSGAAHENMPPSAVVSYIIKAH